jgi:MraZ protein
VAEAFRSEFDQRMDAKGRVSVPADFIRVLKAGDPAVSADKPRPRLVLVYGGNRPCVQGYTVSAMARITRGIERMQNADPKKPLLQRNYITHSVEIEIGDDGRIVLPPKARGRLGLAEVRDGAETVFAGVLDKFEIWHKADYDAKEAAAEAAAGMLIPEGADISSLLPDPDPVD